MKNIHSTKNDNHIELSINKFTKIFEDFKNILSNKLENQQSQINELKKAFDEKFTILDSILNSKLRNG